MNKHVFFKHYPTIAVAGVAVAMILAMITLTSKWSVGWQITLGWLGLVVGFVYFMQQQRLADVRMLHDLFTRFNERYDKLNNTLNRIVEGNEDAILTVEERAALHDYFNLCGEEYFFYTHGYIYPEVWQTWNKGMRWFYAKSERIRLLWKSELEDNSYYGLKANVLGSDESMASPVVRTMALSSSASVS